MSKHRYITLQSEERAQLEKLIHAGQSRSRTQTRARVLLLSDRSLGRQRTGDEVAEAALCSVSTVRRICTLYHESGLDAALYDKGWPGAKPKLNGDIEAKLTMLACSEPPAGQKRWTLRLLADQMVVLGYIDEVSHVTIAEWLKKNELKPWLVKSWCIAQPSARYVAKMEDVLEVYARPYDVRRPVVCLDEKSKELQGTPHGEHPLQPGRERRQDYEYTRNGTANLFPALEPLRGRRSVHVTDRRTASDFAEQVRILVEEEYPDAETIVLVTDNLNTHSTACLYERFSPAQARRIASKLEWHYTPEHGSWLNMAECELSLLARQCLNRRIPDAQTLITET